MTRRKKGGILVKNAGGYQDARSLSPSRHFRCDMDFVVTVIARASGAVGRDSKR
jgi:hypothetical protein